jgi:predicted lipid-binding transport protein (Tim44 family)
MKKAICLAVALAGALALGGCNPYNPQDRAVGGAMIGGATGAAIGAAAGGHAGGAIAGGLLGAAAGGLIGASTTPAPPPPRPRCAQFVFDDYGYRHCVAWY